MLYRFSDIIDGTTSVPKINKTNIESNFISLSTKSSEQTKNQLLNIKTSTKTRSKILKNGSNKKTFTHTKKESMILGISTKQQINKIKSSTLNNIFLSTHGTSSNYSTALFNTNYTAINFTSNKTLNRLPSPDSSIRFDPLSTNHGMLRFSSFSTTTFNPNLLVKTIVPVSTLNLVSAHNESQIFSDSTDFLIKIFLIVFVVFLILLMGCLIFCLHRFIYMLKQNETLLQNTSDKNKIKGINIPIFTISFKYSNFDLEHKKKKNDLNMSNTQVKRSETFFV